MYCYYYYVVNTQVHVYVEIIVSKKKQANKWE